MIDNKATLTSQRRRLENVWRVFYHNYHFGQHNKWLRQCSYYLPVIQEIFKDPKIRLKTMSNKFVCRN